MLDRPRPLLGLACIAVALLTRVADSSYAPRIDIEELPQYDGHQVILEGALRSVQTDRDGDTTVVLQGPDYAVHVRLQEPPAAPLGSWIEVEGRVTQYEGRWWLFAEPGTLQVLRAPTPAEPGWSAIATHPETWQGQPVRLSGQVDDGWLVDDGHRIRIGHGPWPESGAARAVGVIVFEADCLCYRFHAADVETAWN